MRTAVGPYGSENRDQTASHGSLLPLNLNLKKKKKKNNNNNTEKQALNSRTVIRPLGRHALDFFQIWNQKICKEKKKKTEKKKMTK